MNARQNSVVNMLACADAKSSTSSSVGVRSAPCSCGWLGRLAAMAGSTLYLCAITPAWSVEVYQTGFEQPTFAVRPLDGQAGCGRSKVHR